MLLLLFPKPEYRDLEAPRPEPSNLIGAKGVGILVQSFVVPMCEGRDSGGGFARARWAEKHSRFMHIAGSCWHPKP